MNKLIKLLKNKNIRRLNTPQRTNRIINNNNNKEQPKEYDIVSYKVR